MCDQSLGPQDKYRFSIDFPIGSERVINLKEDIRYIKERIQTYRGINTNEIDNQGGQNFEAGVTMVAALNFILQGADNFIPIRCDVDIGSSGDGIGGQTGIALRGLLTMYRDHDHNRIGMTIPVLIDQTYVQYDNLYHGIFSIDISTISDQCIVRTDGVTGKIGSIVSMIGTDYVNRIIEEAVNNNNHNLWVQDAPLLHSTFALPTGEPITDIDADTILCIPANPNFALRYCENFPIPSMLISVARAAFTEIFDIAMMQIDHQGGKENNAEVTQESEHNGERAAGTGAAVPCEG